MGRDYYNRRIGRDGQPPRLGLNETAGQIAAAYAFIDQQAYLQRSFGYFCVDAQQVPGRDGYGIHDAFYLGTGIKIEGTEIEAIKAADEVFLFTLIEFVHDHVAKPIKESGRYHGFSNCGWHFDQDDSFDEDAGRQEWREKVNRILKHYESGYRLSPEGELLHLAPDGLAPLLSAQLPTKTNDTDRDKVTNAARTFQLGRSTRAERKQAVRDLIDILEFHRSQVKEHLLSKDERDLFLIANNFALRHHNDLQRDDYDDNFLTWLFYQFLSTVHLMLGVVTGQTVFTQSRLQPTPPPVTSEHDDIPF
jgi:hypothetical protein